MSKDAQLTALTAWSARSIFPLTERYGLFHQQQVDIKKPLETQEIMKATKCCSLLYLSKGEMS
jgi:hypothetical protein